MAAVHQVFGDDIEDGEKSAVCVGRMKSQTEVCATL